MPYNDDAKDVLWKFYQEYYAQMRHYEMQRSTVTNLLLLVAAAILAFITYDKALSRSDLPLTGLLVIIGLFGAAFSLKHYERSSFHIERARKFRDKLDELLFESTLITHLKREADALHKKNHPILSRNYRGWWRVHRLWVVLHLLIAALGLLLTIFIALWPQTFSSP